MIKFTTIFILAFYTSSSFTQLANNTFLFKSFLINIIYSLNVDGAVLFFKIALRDPNCTYIMNPNKMTNWLIIRVCYFWEIIIIRFILFNWMRVLFFIFVIWTFFSIFMILWICVFENMCIDMNTCSFHGASTNMTDWTWYVDTSWSKRCTNLAYPIISRYFC